MASVLRFALANRGQFNTTRSIFEGRASGCRNEFEAKKLTDAGLELPLPSVQQQRIRIILEPYAREAACPHRAEQMRDLEGGVGGAEAFGPDVGDAVAVRIGGVRSGLPGQVRAHAVGRR